MNISELSEIYSAVYDKLYNDHSEMGTIVVSCCMACFNAYYHGTDSYRTLVMEFEKEREDNIISDRELAAFHIAYEILERRNAFREAGLRVGEKEVV